MTDKVAVRAEIKPIRYEKLNVEQIELLKNTIAKGASNDELQLFIHVCNRLELDPFARQIYALKRRSQEKGQWVERIVFQIGIEGFRLAAQRSHHKGGPKYEGQTAIEWCADDGVWTDLWTAKEPPFAARCGVYVEGFREPIYAIVEYTRVVQKTSDGKPNIFWEKGGAFQLGKCAEAAALRKAFPNELSGVYIKEEVYDEEKDITPPMTVEEAKELPETVTEKITPTVAVEGTPPQGEEPCSPEYRDRAIGKLAGLGILEPLPDVISTIEANLILAAKTKPAAEKVLNNMAKHREPRSLV